MTFTGTPPYDGYPDYNNAAFDPYTGSLSSAYFPVPKRSAVVFEAGGGFTAARPVRLGLDVRPAYQCSPYGDPEFLAPYDWGKDALLVAEYDSARWKLTKTWSVRRHDFNGLYDEGSPSGLQNRLGTALPAPLATQDAPAGWDVALSLGDLSRCLQGLNVGYSGLSRYSSDDADAYTDGSVTITAPPEAPYGLYTFECAYVYTRQTFYAGKVDQTFVLSLGFSVPEGLVRCGAPHFSMVNDPSKPAPGTLALASTGDNSYSITGTGPLPGAWSPGPNYAFLDVLLTLDGVDTDPLYFGPILYTLTVSDPLPNTLPRGYSTPPGASLSYTDPASYKASLPSPDESYTTRFASVLLPADPPHGGARFRWQLAWPFYAGHYTIYFFPQSFFGPAYVYPLTPAEMSTLPHAYFGEFEGRSFAPTGRPFEREEGYGLTPPFLGRLDVTITPWGHGPPPADPPGLPADGGDAAQDHSTGRTTLVKALAAGSGGAATSTLTAEAWEGWQSLAGDPPRPAAPILGADGTPAQGRYPSVCKDGETGRASLCFQTPLGMILRASSQDGLETLMPFPVLLFRNADGSPKTGGRPGHIQDGSTGIYYVAAAFTALDSSGKPTGKEDILIARVDATDAVLPWADGADQKAVVLGTAAAGRPALVLNRYDPAQPLLLLHGDRKFLGSLGGEQWDEIL